MSAIRRRTPGPVARNRYEQDPILPLQPMIVGLGDCYHDRLAKTYRLRLRGHFRGQ